MHGSSLPVGLSVAGMTYTFGRSPHAARPAYNCGQVMDYAYDRGLAGVEVPASMLENEKVDGGIEALGALAADRGLFVVVDTNGYDPAALARVITVAQRIGAPTVRTVVGGAKLGGDRRALAGRWNSFLTEVHQNLALAAEIAERADINLAVENHQDLASDELLWLCDSIGSPRFGITLDTANPLATAEEPVEFVRRVAPYVKNVHLKDYWTWRSEEGYFLARCPVGHGLTDIPAMRAILDAHGNTPTQVIELAALEARHVRVFAQDFWPDYPGRIREHLADALRVVDAHAKTDGDWRTPFERGDPADSVVDYEQHELIQSIDYLRTI